MKFFFFSLTAIIIFFSCQDHQSTTSDDSQSVQSQPSAGQVSEQKPQSPDKLNTVEDIRREYAYLSSQLQQNKLDSVSFEYDCYGEKKGTVTYFSENENLRIIRHKYAEYSHHEATDRYFLKNDSLFFVYYNRLNWSFDTESEQGATKDDITENRYYLLKGKPVQCLEKKFTVYSSSEDNPDSGSVENKQISCPSLQTIMADLTLLQEYKNQRATPIVRENSSG